MYKETLYIVAYERIKSAPGNLTPGSDSHTIDGFSLQMIRQIIEEMRTEQFHFKPVRTVFIPKPNGKMRKLGIPSIRDKIVQEVIHMILEAIYDSPYGAYFTNTSHGFRPHRSCHSALQVIRDEWGGTNWFLEGDIQSCFDAIDHGVLVQLLRKKIKDERFLNLIWKLLRAGYLTLQESRKESLAGTPQGGLVSPLLANVYLHELDDKIADIRAREERGSTKATNREYKRLTDRIYRLRKKGATNTPELRALIQQRRSLPSVVVNDPNFVRIKYQRYADDWIVGICGPRSLAERIKEELTTFLSERLRLTLSKEKTHITHARTEEAHFLGTLISVRSTKAEAKVALTRNGSGHLIKRRSTGSELLLKAPIKQLVERLHQRGLCTSLGKPTAKGGWTALDADQIVSLYNGINRGIQNYYRFADNFSRLNQLQYILYISLVKTLAMKYRCTAKRIYQRFGKEITIHLPRKKEGKDYHISFFLNHEWKKQRDGFQLDSMQIDQVQWTRRLYTRSKLGQACCVCNATIQVEMHHIRHIRKVGGKKPTGFNVILQALNRKQIPVCRSCHQRIHRGEYDQMRLSDLAYNPYASEKRK